MTDTTDRELLILAAKAAGYKLLDMADGVSFYHINTGGFDKENWNPLTDDGDALRLAVHLNLLNDRLFNHERDVLMFTKNTPKLEATRRAVVRAAAETGRLRHD